MIHKKYSFAAFVVSLAFSLLGSFTAFAASPSAINLGSSGNFAVLAKTGISTTGSTVIVGDIGISPAVATYITGFALNLPSASAYATSALITGKVYAPGYADPTPANLSTAVLDMQNAYTDGAGRASTVTELGAGNIGGRTLAAGVYKWGSGVLVPSDVTLSGSANDVWIFQIAQNLDVSSGVKIILAGGAQTSNIFWVVAGQTTLGTTAIMNGNILDQTAIVFNTGATLNGRALAQSAVTLDASTVTIPNYVAPAPVVPVPSSPTVCTQDAKLCPNGSYVSRIAPNCMFADCPTTTPVPSVPTVSVCGASQHSCPCTTGSYCLAMGAMCISPTSACPVTTPTPTPAPGNSNFGQQVKAIATSLGKGSSNTSVTVLQQFLISQDKGPAAKALAKAGATSYFGNLTRAALAEYQKSVGISPALGNFGSITRAYIGSH